MKTGHTYQRLAQLGIIATCLLIFKPADAGNTAPTILITHPRAIIMRTYVTLVRQHVLAIPGLRLVGVYHASETEDYQDAQAYLDSQKLPWASLRVVHCPLSGKDVYNATGCREEFRKLVESSSAIIFNGGPDMPPNLYGKPQLLTTRVETPHRHEFEISLLVNLLGTARVPSVQPLLANRPEYPIMAICLGMQSLNVANGGTLLQDIPSQIYGSHTVEDAQNADPNTWHRNHLSELNPEPTVSPGVLHPIVLTDQAPASLLPWAKRPPQVLSVHHQAIDELGRDYVVTATSLDGKVIEGIRHKIFSHVHGWQFHPERSGLWDANEEQRRSEADPQKNFIYDTLTKNPNSRAFAKAIWNEFARSIDQYLAKQP